MNQPFSLPNDFISAAAPNFMSEPERANVEDGEVRRKMRTVDAGIDPNRFGPLNVPTTITDHDRAQARLLQKQELTRDNVVFNTRSLNYFMEYPHTRNQIAKAVMCGFYHANFSKVAGKKADKPLLEHLLKYKADIHKDCTLFEVSSLKSVKLLVELGASMQQCSSFNNDTVLHHACYGECPPAVLEYYVQHARLPINVTNRYGDTPFHTWAEKSIRGSLDTINTAYVEEAKTKLMLLLGAGADHALNNNGGNRPLDILEFDRMYYRSWDEREDREVLCCREEGPEQEAYSTLIKAFLKETNK
jgi:hypothetical protein